MTYISVVPKGTRVDSGFVFLSKYIPRIGEIVVKNDRRYKVEDVQYYLEGCHVDKVKLTCTRL
jgi:uncharacterized protein YqgV (UPF0045/DUF77 family)